MSNIVIDDKWKLSHDRYCWTLSFREEGEINEKTGKRKVRTWEGHFPTFELALYSYVDQNVKVEGNIETVIRKLDEIKSTIRKVNELRSIK